MFFIDNKINGLTSEELLPNDKPGHFNLRVQLRIFWVQNSNLVWIRTHDLQDNLLPS